MRIRRENQAITIIVFVVILLAVGLLHLILPEKDVSVEEKRHLRRFPELNFQDAKTGEQSVKIEGWFSDQFPFRSTLIEVGKGWRKIAFPNLNKDGMQIIPIDHDLTGEDDPDETDQPEPLVTDPTDPLPSQTDGPIETEPPIIPTIEAVSYTHLDVYKRQTLYREQRNLSPLQRLGLNSIALTVFCVTVTLTPYTLNSMPSLADHD